MMTGFAVVMHPGMGRKSRAGEHGDGNNGEQDVPEHSHFFAPFGESGAAFVLRPGRWMQHDMNTLCIIHNIP